MKHTHTPHDILRFYVYLLERFRKAIKYIFQAVIYLKVFNHDRRLPIDDNSSVFALEGQFWKFEFNIKAFILCYVCPV